MQPIIEVKCLSKKYQLGAIGATRLRDDLERCWHRLTGKVEKKDEQEFWALRDVSFEVQPGEVLGIIGRNGAGKSTLLKILSRITDPTSGEAVLRGRVASLLEVGTGFHPDLTGRENIYINGAILGMSRVEVTSKLDEIVVFAEIDKFIDTPVKRYSSGMYVRLAFAVAAHLDPEILIVDEVLAVGDLAFQKKCLARMHLVAEAGRTVIFVSHNMQAISTLTTRCLWLKNGEVRIDAQTNEGVSAYLEDGVSPELEYTANNSELVGPAITGAKLNTSHPGNVQVSGQPLSADFEIYTPHPVKNATLSFCVIDSTENRIIHSWLFGADTPLLESAGTHRLRCTFPQLSLYMGRYSITAFLSEGEGGAHYQTVERICPFEVVMFGQERNWKWQENACKYMERWSWEVLAEPVECPCA